MAGLTLKTPSRSNKPTFDSPARLELIAQLSIVDPTLTPTHHPLPHSMLQSSSTTNPPPPPPATIKPTLSDIPLEIKRYIVLCVNDLELDDDGFCTDDSDIEDVDDDEFTSKDLNQKIITRSQAALILAQSASSNLDPSPSLPTPTPIPIPHQQHQHIRPILALALVNRTFYELCRPFIWETLDLEGCTTPKLQLILNDLIPRQADHIRSLWWRVSHAELEEFEDNFPRRPTVQTEPVWDEEARSVLLLKLLQACRRLTSLDIDLCPATVANDGSWVESSPASAMYKFLTPVSQLRGLQRLALSAPADGKPFSERFLVRLIQDMAHLESFSCSYIDAMAPKGVQPCESPLGIHLASLDSLSHLDLTNAECFDTSWSKLKWRGRLATLALDECPRASLEALYGFTSLFTDSLVNLELDNVPYVEDGFAEPASALLDTGKYVFKLDSLIALSISNALDERFIRSFSESKKLEMLELGQAAVCGHQELEDIIRDQIWPKLERLGIINDLGILSGAEIEALELFCLTRGVTVEVESESEDDDDDEFDEDSLVSDEVSELEDLQHEWQDED